MVLPDVVITTHYGATNDEDDLMTTRFEYGGQFHFGMQRAKKVIDWTL